MGRYAAVCYATEVVLAGAACLCYRRLPDLLEELEESPVAERLFLIATVLIAFCPVRVGFGISPGIALACFFVLPVGEGSAGYRTAVGAGFGLAVDLTLGAGGLYTCALGAGGLLAEAARHRGRFLQTGLFLLAGAAAVIWFGGAVPDAREHPDRLSALLSPAQGAGNAAPAVFPAGTRRGPPPCSRPPTASASR